MTPASLPSNEAERLAALRRYDILDTPAEAAFDDVTELAALICGMPIALVSLVDVERQWFKSRLGLDAPQTPRDISFCGHAIHGRELFEVPNTLEDARFRDNPLVTAAPDIRAYAGAPLITADGLALGTFCVIDRVPHRLTPEQRDGLMALARQVAQLLELRLAGRQLQDLNRDLAQQSSFQQALLESAALAIISTTVQGVITSFNPAAEQMLGYKSEDLVGKLNPGVFHDGAEVAARAVELSRELGRKIEPGFEVFVATARAGKPESREWTYLRKDGSRVPVRLTVSAVRDEAGEVIGFLGIARDISERKHLERERERRAVITEVLESIARAANESRTPEEALRRCLRRIYDYGKWSLGCALAFAPGQSGGVPTAVFWHSENPARFAEFMRISDNRAYAAGDGDILDRARQEKQAVWLSKLPPRAQAPRMAVAAEAGLRSALAFPLLVDGEFAACLEFYSEVEIREPDSLLRDAISSVAAQIALIIERDRAKEALRAAMERAQAADRLKSSFLATMSHELRTPLNSIIGFTGILIQGLAGPLNTEQGKQLGMVQTSARHLLALINDVLDISKIEAGELGVDCAPLDLGGAVTKALFIVTPLAETKGLALRADALPALGAMMGDQRRVEQILINLLNNAIKFTERGEVALSVALAGAAVRIGIADTGMGIKPQDMAVLFQPFRQIDDGLSRNHEGTGLGLAICKRLAELMGGQITAESEWGKGSVFTFTLPIKGPQTS